MIQPTETEQISGGAAQLDGLSVLVIEDEFYLADDTSRALEDAGARVMGPFGRFSDAADAIRSETPDCAVLDINLGSGPDFTSAYAMQGKGVPLLFVTGYDHAVIPPELASVACLQKPTTGRKIVELVKALCAS